ncbi:MAG: hypothetical protein QM621_12645 [Aeromicrobium sp.]|uniref:hypothetical protein n=1 Tax=Aeromicrobium sp. TaxID=1871063 RepID=UPI0039E6B1DA
MPITTLLSTRFSRIVAAVVGAMILLAFAIMFVLDEEQFTAANTVPETSGSATPTPEPSDDATDDPQAEPSPTVDDTPAAETGGSDSNSSSTAETSQGHTPSKPVEPSAVPTTPAPTPTVGQPTATPTPTKTTCLVVLRC